MILLKLNQQLMRLVKLKGFFFSGVVGLIDATHVYIRAPEHDIDAYINSKKFHSLGLQVKWTTEEPSNNYVKPI